MTKQSTHLAALVPALATDLVLEQRPTPSPGADEVLIRNHAIAINPIDWKRPAWGYMISSYPVVLGADVSGIVAEVGSSVTNFKPGDRVVGFGHSFSSGNNDNAAQQEFTVTKAILTTPLPEGTSFQQGATLPTATGTAVMALFDILGLPLPEVGETKPALKSSQSILVWGGASSVGFATIQIARLAGLTVFAAASKRHHEHLRSLGVSEVVDYRSPTAVDDLLAAAERTGTPISYAVDSISTAETIAPVVEVLSKSTSTTKRIVHTINWPEGITKPDGIEAQQVLAQELFQRRKDLAVWLSNENLPKWLESGEFETQKYKVVEGGLGGLQNGMNELKKGISGVKLVVEV